MVTPANNTPTREEYEWGFLCQGILHVYVPMPLEKFQRGQKKNKKIWGKCCPDPRWVMEKFERGEVKWQFMHFTCGFLHLFHPYRDSSLWFHPSGYIIEREKPEPPKLSEEELNQMCGWEVY
jgi:hypothetical protein